MKKSIVFLLALVFLLTACGRDASQETSRTNESFPSTETIPDTATISGYLDPARTTELQPFVISAVSKVNLESEEYRTPSVRLCLSDGVIFFARAADQTVVGGGLHSYSVWKADFAGEKVHIGDFDCYTSNPYMAANLEYFYFAVTEAFSEQMVYEGQYTNIIYRIRLSDLTMEEVYRSKETLPGFYMDILGDKLMIRQARRDGESYTTWIECYDPEQKEVLYKTEDYTSVNGVGRYMLNISVDGNTVYGLLTERDQADEEHETPSVVVFDNNLRESGRILTDAVKDYLIFTYPYRFHVRNGLVEVTNGNQSETLIAVIGDGSLKEVFRKQNVQQTFTNRKDTPWVFFDLSEKTVYTCDPENGTVLAAKILFADDSFPIELYPAGETMLAKAVSNVEGTVYYRFEEADIPFEKLDILP